MNLNLNIKSLTVYGAIAALLWAAQHVGWLAPNVVSHLLAVLLGAALPSNAITINGVSIPLPVSVNEQRKLAALKSSFENVSDPPAAPPLTLDKTESLSPKAPAAPSSGNISPLLKAEKK